MLCPHLVNPMRKLLCLLLCLSSSAFAQKWEGLALTPPMGWNSWNTFAGDINDLARTWRGMLAAIRP